MKQTIRHGQESVADDSCPGSCGDIDFPGVFRYNKGAKCFPCILSENSDSAVFFYCSVEPTVGFQLFANCPVVTVKIKISSPKALIGVADNSNSLAVLRYIDSSAGYDCMPGSVRLLNPAKGLSAVKRQGKIEVVRLVKNYTVVLNIAFHAKSPSIHTMKW